MNKAICKFSLQASLPHLQKRNFISCLWISPASVMSTSHSSLVCQAVGYTHNLLFYLAKCISGDLRNSVSAPNHDCTWIGHLTPMSLFFFFFFFICEKDGWRNKFEQINSHEAVIFMVSIVSADYQQVTCCCKSSGFLFFVAPSAGPAQRSRTGQCLQQTWWPVGDALHRWAPGQRELNAFCNHCHPRRPSQIRAE